MAKTENRIMVASEAKVGDWINLEGDSYADPRHDKPLLVEQYVQVGAVDTAEPDRVCIHFTGFDTVIFPAGHPLRFLLGGWPKTEERPPVRLGAGLPDCPAAGCWCLPESDLCICGGDEAALRWWAYRPGHLPPMTDEQRAWALDQIAAVEGYDRVTHEGDSDSDLARTVLTAWMDFARDKGLL